MESVIWYVLAAILVIVGLLGTVLPVLPGALLVFAGLFIAAWADDFSHVGKVGITLIATLGLLSAGADFLGTIMGAKRVGASAQALIGATLGGLVGLLFGVPGIILGPFMGAVAGELLARGRIKQAGKVGIGTWLGLLAAAVLKVVIAFLMIATFVAFYTLN
jgi:uncharacterized protein YqgC (DUF456 family)